MMMTGEEKRSRKIPSSISVAFGCRCLGFLVKFPVIASIWGVQGDECLQSLLLEGLDLGDFLIEVHGD